LISLDKFNSLHHPTPTFASFSSLPFRPLLSSSLFLKMTDQQPRLRTPPEDGPLSPPLSPKCKTTALDADGKLPPLSLFSLLLFLCVPSTLLEVELNRLSSLSLSSSV